MKTRIISAAILLPVAIIAIVLGDWPFTLLIAVAVLLAGMEYTQLVRRKGYEVSLVWVWLITLLWLADARWELGEGLTLGLALLTLLVSGYQVLRRSKVDPTASWALSLAGGFYLGIGGAYLLKLRLGVDGLWWVLTAIPAVWIGDSMAYFVGRRYGRHKMIPAVSPGKSWEGYAAEVVVGILTGALLGMLWPRIAETALTLNWWRGMVVGGVLAAVAPLGDFFVSVIKREVGVKDSGNLIPGHGGAFDRIDSLLWTGVLACALLELLL
ncbi:MAG: phosphatidate cytidylyltransferase [Anaerolineae bacterium]|jgi:phosphatidate cytidylyltransferase|nr:phosphatidate cytidylyltransferase [Anaerolineae bacterium]